MKYITALQLTLSGALLCACTQPGVDLDAERAALRAAADAYHEAGQAFDVDSFVNFYATDALMLPPHAAREMGHEGVRNFFSAFTEMPDANVSFSESMVDVAASGDMGYTLADATVSFTGPGGELVEETGPDFHLWKKRDGQWKIAIDIWNSEDPMPAAAAAPASMTRDDDAVLVDPQRYAVEFENDKVRIIRINYGPGEKSVMHTHGPNAAIFLSDIEGRMTLPDGTSMDITVEAGATQWADDEKHLPENLSDEPFEVVLVELKQ